MSSIFVSVATLTSFLISSSCASRDSALLATAQFYRHNNGVKGAVMVVDGDLEVYIDVNDLDLSLIPDKCFEGGLGFHIHELWKHNDLSDRITSECGRQFTGNHWDPWVACGPATDNDLCISDGGCVPVSSVLNGDGYNCNPYTFSINPYVCEVGDWSGKYGKAFVNDDGFIILEASSSFEVSAADLEGLSVVFHCNSGARVFCAPFEVKYTNGVSVKRPSQSNNEDLVANFDVLGGYSSVLLGYHGTVSVDLNLDRLDTSVCKNGELALRIYNDYDLAAPSATYECENAVGQFFDPTQTCAPDSDSIYCDNGVTCGTGTEYSCNFDTPFDRFSCVPGDITGKFGTFNAYEDARLYVNDPLMIDLSVAAGKSVVLQCADSYKILACAKLIPSDPEMTESPTPEPTEEM